MNTVANFVKERNEALFSLDRKKIEAYCAKYGDSDSANVPDVVFWAGVYKAICEIKNAPEERADRSYLAQSTWVFCFYLITV